MKKVLGQIVKLFLLLFAISIITFALMKIAPIDPVASYLGADSNVTTEQYEYLTKVWGLDRPVLTQYLSWIKGVFRGDMGNSFAYHKPVFELISNASANTFMLMFTSWILSGILGFVLGLISAAHRGKLTDHIIQKIFQ